MSLFINTLFFSVHVTHTQPKSGSSTRAPLKGTGETSSAFYKRVTSDTLCFQVSFKEEEVRLVFVPGGDQWSRGSGEKSGKTQEKVKGHRFRAKRQSLSTHTAGIAQSCRWSYPPHTLTRTHTHTEVLFQTF